MSKSTITVIRDDLTGEQIDEADYRLITFTAFGKTYSLDTTEEGEDEFRKALEPFIFKAHVAPLKYRPQQASAAKKIREWARSKGRDVPKRGRLSEDLIREYEDAMARENK